MKAIQKELGDSGDAKDDIFELEQKLKKLNYPQKLEKKLIQNSKNLKV